MDRARLVAALGSKLEPALSASLVDHFLKIREDAATRTLERAVAGKFVETFVQCLQWIRHAQWLDLDRLAGQELFEEIAGPYIKQKLLSIDA